MAGNTSQKKRGGCLLHADAFESSVHVENDPAMAAAAFSVYQDLFSHYIEHFDGEFQIQDGDSYVMGCKRNHGRINCDLTFKDKSTNEEAYNIVIDSPPLLFMKSDSGASFLAINTTSGFAGHTTRLVHQEFLGEKVCNGIFMTEFQRKNFE